MKWVIAVPQSKLPMCNDPDRWNYKNKRDDLRLTISASNRIVMAGEYPVIDCGLQPFDVLSHLGGMLPGVTPQVQLLYKYDQLMPETVLGDDLIATALDKLGALRVYWLVIVGYTRNYDLRLYYTLPRFDEEDEADPGVWVPMERND